MFVFPARRFLGVLVANKPVYTPLPAAVVVLKAAVAVAVWPLCKIKDWNPLHKSALSDATTTTTTTHDVHLHDAIYNPTMRKKGLGIRPEGVARTLMKPETYTTTRFIIKAVRRQRRWRRRIIKVNKQVLKLHGSEEEEKEKKKQPKRDGRDSVFFFFVPNSFAFFHVDIIWRRRRRRRRRRRYSADASLSQSIDQSRAQN